MRLSGFMEDASIIFCGPLEKDTDPKCLDLKVENGTKDHQNLCYTTDVETFKLIIENMTFRSSSLTYAKLNDPMEKERVGVSDFAKGRFITCFCHSDHESVPFWMLYGGTERDKKIMLRFRNFANEITDYIQMDYALVKENKKCLFKSPKYGEIINSLCNDNDGQEEYDLRSRIDSFHMFDVEYIPCDSEEFKKDYSGNAYVDFSLLTGQETPTVPVKKFEPTVLGRQKSNPWDYEKETRILLSLMGMQFPDWDYIDLRLKPEIFRNMQVVISPWGEEWMIDEIKGIIAESKLTEDIKSSITIVNSCLHGKLNFPD